MLQTEFLRSLNCNYERILLNKNPEENKYQYCMISRGGIKGLLSCSLRYINGLAYLYYDITSKQNLPQICGKRPVTRKWLCDFMWSMQKMEEELTRFLLDGQNILWYPQQIFRDLESEVYSFLYVPYYEGDNGFKKFLEFLIEHIDYEDEALVECVYRMYEQYDAKGQDYLQSQIFKDLKVLEESEVQVSGEKINQDMAGKEHPERELAVSENEFSGKDYSEKEGPEKGAGVKRELTKREKEAETIDSLDKKTVGREKMENERKGLGNFFKNKRKKDQDARTDYRKLMELEMAGYAVAENDGYEEEVWGKTIFMEEEIANVERIHSLYTPEGRLLATLDKDFLIIGKRKEEVDVVIEDMSVSRMHARILKEKDGVYLEDLNSTNGTFKNGLRMEPYEKRKLETGDEIKLGKKELVYR